MRPTVTPASKTVMCFSSICVATCIVWVSWWVLTAVRTALEAAWWQAPARMAWGCLLPVARRMGLMMLIACHVGFYIYKIVRYHNTLLLHSHCIFFLYSYCPKEKVSWHCQWLGHPTVIWKCIKIGNKNCFYSQSMYCHTLKYSIRDIIQI